MKILINVLKFCYCSFKRKKTDCLDVGRQQYSQSTINESLLKDSELLNSSLKIIVNPAKATNRKAYLARGGGASARKQGKWEHIPVLPVNGSAVRRWHSPLSAGKSVLEN